MDNFVSPLRGATTSVCVSMRIDLHNDIIAHEIGQFLDSTPPSTR